MTLTTQIFFWAMSFILILLVTVSLRQLPGIQSLNLAMLCTVFFIFFQNNIRDLNNYQFFKAMSYALPILVFLVAISWTTKISSRITSKSLVVIVLLLVSASTFHYLRTFSSRIATHTYEQKISSDAVQPKVRRELERFNLLARGDHIVMGSLVSSSNIFWMHRGIQGYETNFMNRMVNPLGWIVFNDDKKLFNCISDHLGAPAIRGSSDSFHVYQVLTESKTTVIDAGEAAKAMSVFFADHDLGSVESGWQPSVCKQKDMK